MTRNVQLLILGEQLPSDTVRSSLQYAGQSRWSRIANVEVQLYHLHGADPGEIEPVRKMLHELLVDNDDSEWQG
jgi:hypothetical protein